MYDGAKDAYSCVRSRQSPFFRGALCTITLSYKGIKNNASPMYDNISLAHKTPHAPKRWLTPTTTEEKKTT